MGLRSQRAAVQEPKHYRNVSQGLPGRQEGTHNGSDDVVGHLLRTRPAMPLGKGYISERGPTLGLGIMIITTRGDSKRYASERLVPLRTAYRNTLRAYRLTEGVEEQREARLTVQPADVDRNAVGTQESRLLLVVSP
jgi:hypothetical protein